MEHKKQPKCDYDDVLDIIQMRPKYDIGDLTHILVDKNKYKIVTMINIQRSVNFLWVFKTHKINYKEGHQ